MRRSRRGGHAGLEFGGSGEDSFVAVVVTKLTGALLFILLLTMVIMALLPKAIDLPSSAGRDPAKGAVEAPPLAVATPEELPEAIAGRPYVVALASSGGSGPVRWAVDGKLPDGLALDPATGQIRGTPTRGTPEPARLTLRATDGSARAAGPARLVVYQPDRPLTMPSKYLPAVPPIPWREWLEQGFGFLVLILVHIVGMGALDSLGRRALADAEAEGDEEAEARARRRFGAYRLALRVASLASAAALATWLARPPA